jgi:3-deoxy-manno-octulosonate cytidylyltransferase (CMP-KDO synthetase)
MSPAFKVVIPARYGSTRLPGKPLLPIAGQPMIAHVCRRAMAAQAEQVVVATDDQRIFDVVQALGLQVVMTSSDHQSGTERIAEVAAMLAWSAEDIIVNVQGDEPLIPPDYIRHAATALYEARGQAGMATLAAQIHHNDELFNPNAVKVVLDAQGNALYFSRAAIPWSRATFPDRHDMRESGIVHLRHIGLYAYTVDFLQRYCNWSVSPLEDIESLEQLRVLWHGERIRVHVVAQPPEAGVDTEDDLKRVASRLSAV